MSSDSSRTRRGQIDRLITLLAQDVNSHVSGRGFAPKLIQTAVNVVSKDVATSQDKIERDIASAKQVFAQTANGAQFEQHLLHLLEKGTPYVEDLLIILHTIHSSANTKQALSIQQQRVTTPPATALQSPSSIHNQLAQLQDQPQSARTPALPLKQSNLQEPSSHARRDSNSSASTSAGPTPLSRSGLQTVERLSAASSLRQRQQTQEPSSPAVQSRQDGHMFQKQTQYRNPVYGQEEGFSPARAGPAYAPVLTNALPARQPSHLSLTNPNTRVQAFGDLFGPPSGSLPTVTIPDCPQLPDWSHQRPYLTGQFLLEGLELDEATPERQQALESFSSDVQELVVMEDMLWAFMGFEGKYIRLRRNRSLKHGLSYFLEGRVEHALHELVTRMLPICEYVVTVQRFVETRSAYSWGLVCHAVAACMRGVLQDWNLMVTQLEHQLRTGKLTLQALWYYCQPALASLQLLASLAAEAAAGKLRGSALLNLLHQRSNAMAGDDQARRLTQKLMHAACKPYFRMLELWLCEGIVQDPYAEFMVQEHKDVTKDSLDKNEQSAYWYHRYSLRPLLDLKGHVSLTPTGAPLYDVPLLLSEAQETILMTGKYLNAIRECGRPVQRSLPADVHVEYGGGSFMQHIQTAFTTSSAALLGLLQQDLGLNRTLLALKHYFLLDQGDLLVSFLDTAEEELAKPASQVSVIRLQSLLDLAVRSSSAAGDPTTEKLQCFLDHRSLLGMLQQQSNPQDPTAPQHTSNRPPLTPRQAAVSDPTLLRSRLGREAFLLNYKVDWPLSIVVSQQSMAQYQLIFRHLFELKYVEQQLNNVWQILQSTRRLYRWSNDTLNKCYSLCQHMMHFFHQFLLYVTFEVLEPLWHNMSIQSHSAKTLDQVIEHHSEFLRKVLKGCLLSRKLTLLQSLMQLKRQAARFALVSQALQAQLDTRPGLQVVPQGDTTYRRHKQREDKAAAATAVLQAAIEDEQFANSISNLETSFGTQFQEFIAELQEMHQTAQTDAKESREELDSLSNLIGRLDFNDFFKPKPDYRAMLANGLI